VQAVLTNAKQNPPRLSKVLARLAEINTTNGGSARGASGEEDRQLTISAADDFQRADRVKPSPLKSDEDFAKELIYAVVDVEELIDDTLEKLVRTTCS